MRFTVIHIIWFMNREEKRGLRQHGNPFRTVETAVQQTLFFLSFYSMPAERKQSVNMDEKDVCSFTNKEKEKDRDGERRPPVVRDKPKDEAKMTGKKDGGKEEKRKRLEEEKKKKEEKERKKKEEEKQKAEEEQKKKEEEEKRQQEEQEKKLQEEEAKRQREEEAALLK